MLKDLLIMRTLFVTAFVCFFSFIYSQNNSLALLTSINNLNEAPTNEIFKADNSYIQPFDRATRQPIGRYILSKIKYPEIAKVYGAEGTAVVKIIIDASGSPQSIEFLKKAHPMLDPTIKDVFQTLPKFEPAYRDGEPVVHRLILPIKFYLQ